MEKLFVSFQDIADRRQLDLCKNTESLLKLTPEDDCPVYSLNPATPILLWDEFF